MTEKLYYEDSGIHEFTARVLACEPSGKNWSVILDRTAFFPEGGGQSADTGSIGEVQVLDVHEKGGVIRHTTDAPLPVGGEFACALDWEQRRRRMQNHSGEHVVSGLVHSRYGLENVGFHMGKDCMTMDYNGELDWEALTEIERLANEVVRDDLPVRVWFPEPEVLQTLEYRSKLELTEDVRIVEIPGVDNCACCAPHVTSTGQIGVIKLLTAERHRGGTRVTALCGMDALDDYHLRQESVAEISALLSVKRPDVAGAVERLLQEQEKHKERETQLSRELVRLRAESVAPREGNICLFDELLGEIALRELVNLLMEKCTGVAAVFQGSDAEGYRYVIGSRHVDLRAASRAINAGIGGRGGGSSSMIQGRAQLGADAIQTYIEGASF